MMSMSLLRKSDIGTWTSSSRN